MPKASQADLVILTELERWREVLDAAMDGCNLDRFGPATALLLAKLVGRFNGIDLRPLQRIHSLIVGNRHVTASDYESALVPWAATREALIGGAVSGKEPARIVVDAAACTIAIDGQTFPVTPNAAEAVRLMIENPGEYVGMAKHGIRSRDLEKLPKPILALIQTDKGIGSKINLK